MQFNAYMSICLNLTIPLLLYTMADLITMSQLLLLYPLLSLVVLSDNSRSPILSYNTDTYSTIITSDYSTFY